MGGMYASMAPRGRTQLSPTQWAVLSALTMKLQSWLQKLSYLRSVTRRPCSTVNRNVTPNRP